MLSTYSSAIGSLGLCLGVAKKASYSPLTLEARDLVYSSLTTDLVGGSIAIIVIFLYLASLVLPVVTVDRLEGDNAFKDLLLLAILPGA